MIVALDCERSDLADEDTQIVDVKYLDEMLEASPPDERPEPRELGDGVLVSRGYMQLVAAAALLERRRRLGSGHP